MHTSQSMFESRAEFFGDLLDALGISYRRRGAVRIDNAFPLRAGCRSLHLYFNEANSRGGAYFAALENFYGSYDWSKYWLHTRVDSPERGYLKVVPFPGQERRALADLMNFARHLELDPERFVLPWLAAALTGLTERAIRAKIEEGVWLEGKEWVRGRELDKGIFIDLEGYRRWKERQGGTTLSGGQRAALLLLEDATQKQELLKAQAEYLNAELRTARGRGPVVRAAPIHLPQC